MCNYIQTRVNTMNDSEFVEELRKLPIEDVLLKIWPDAEDRTQISAKLNTWIRERLNKERVLCKSDANRALGWIMAWKTLGLTRRQTQQIYFDWNHQDFLC